MWNPYRSGFANFRQWKQYHDWKQIARDRATRNAAVAEFVMFTSNEYLVLTVGGCARCLRSKRAAILHADLAQTFLDQFSSRNLQLQVSFIALSYVCLGQKKTSLKTPV